MKKRLFIVNLMLCMLLSAYAQESPMLHIYNQAEENYSIGRIEQAQAILEENIAKFPSTLQESVYRLLSLCSLALDKPASAEQYASQLLTISPYYSPALADPQRFKDLVNNIKFGRSTTMTTASSQAESISEVPVPAMVITEEMIRDCGAQNLQEVLAAYVPGMHVIDCNHGINIAMRGVFSNDQEKILIMLNGHRMNSYATNSASPDFSMSLEKIKQIEVLRGPASSLYGGVALTGVVNVITKRGGDLDGILLKAGVGNHDQLRGDLMFGKHYFNLDLLVWGSIYKNSGESTDNPSPVDYKGRPQGRINIGRAGNSPSYDFGIQMKYKDLQFLYNTHFSQLVPPLTISTLGASYDYSAYKTFNGITPGFTTNSHHADLNYTRRIGNLNAKATLTYDNSDLTHYQVISDYAMPELGDLLVNQDSIKRLFNNPGIYRYINGQEQTYGAQLKGDIDYIKTGSHKGNLMFGAEYSHFQLKDVRYQLGYNFTNITPESHTIQETGKGHEDNYNAFLQLKHQWKNLIFNAGLRYDHKRRYDDSRVNEYSPRVALIYVRPKWNLKLSYSRSFVDAPYLYRKTNEILPILQGNQFEGTLDPESLQSYQITFASTEWIKGLSFEVNGFYNRASDLIITHLLDYVNEGKNKTMGIEFLAHYSRQRFTADLNFSWLNTVKNTIFAVDVDDNNNTPALRSNLLLTWQPVSRLRLSTHILFEGRQTSYNSDLSQMFRMSHIAEQIDIAKKEGQQDVYEKLLDEMAQTFARLIYSEKIDPHVIFDLGATYQLGKFTFGANIHNILNTHYMRSGMSTRLVPQKGRWMMFTVGYKF